MKYKHYSLTHYISESECHNLAFILTHALLCTYWLVVQQEAFLWLEIYLYVVMIRRHHTCLSAWIEEVTTCEKEHELDMGAVWVFPSYQTGIDTPPKVV